MSFSLKRNRLIDWLIDRSIDWLIDLNSLIPKCVTLFHHTRWRRERGFWNPISPDDHIFSISSVSTGWGAFGLLPSLFASNLFSCTASLKLLRTQWLKIFRGRSCLLPVDMDAPESTFVNHCDKFVMFLVHILCLCNFLLSSALFLESSAWEAAVLLTLKLHRD